LLLSILASTIKYVSNFRVNLQLTLFNIILWLPCGRYYIQKEQKKSKEDFYQRVKSKRKNTVIALPEKPWSKDQILQRIQ
jgi:sphinganine-1-phosphate aldolase